MATLSDLSTRAKAIKRVQAMWATYSHKLHDGSDNSAEREKAKRIAVGIMEKHGLSDSQCGCSFGIGAKSGQPRGTTVGEYFKQQRAASDKFTKVTKLLNIAEMALKNGMPVTAKSHVDSAYKIDTEFTRASIHNLYRSLVDILQEVIAERKVAEDPNRYTGEQEHYIWDEVEQIAPDWFKNLNDLFDKFDKDNNERVKVGFDPGKESFTFNFRDGFKGDWHESQKRVWEATNPPPKSTKNSARITETFNAKGELGDNILDAEVKIVCEVYCFAGSKEKITTQLVLTLHCKEGTELFGVQNKWDIKLTVTPRFRQLPLIKLIHDSKDNAGIARVAERINQAYACLMNSFLFSVVQDGHCVAMDYDSFMKYAKEWGDVIPGHTCQVEPI